MFHLVVIQKFYIRNFPEYGTRTRIIHLLYSSTVKNLPQIQCHTHTLCHLVNSVPEYMCTQECKPLRFAMVASAEVLQHRIIFCMYYM